MVSQNFGTFKSSIRVRRCAQETELNVGKKNNFLQKMLINEVLSIGKKPDNFADITSRFFSKIISRSGDPNVTYY